MKIALSASSVNQVIYYDKPPMCGGKKTILTKAQAEEMLGISLYEGLYVSDDETLKQLKALTFEPKVSVPYAHLERQLQEHLKSPFAGLSLAKINDEVGIGVFAEQDIPAGTVLGIYSGVIHNKINTDSLGNDYLMRMTDDFYVCGSKYRNFTSFMQHLPTNYQRMQEQMEKQMLDKNYMAMLLRTNVAAIEAAFRDNRLTKDVICEIAAEATMFNAAGNTEFSDIEFSFTDPNYASTLATANVIQERMMVNGIMVLAIVTQLPIKKGEIVGLTYMAEYWHQKGVVPELFRRYGEVVPHEFYKRVKNIRIIVDVADEKLSIEADHSQLMQHIESNEPVKLNDTVSISSYEERRALVAANAVSAYYGELPLNTVAEHIKAELNKTNGGKVKVSLFWQRPQAIEQKPKAVESYAVDIVCHALDDISFNKTKHLLKPLIKHSKIFATTREIVLPGVNLPEQAENMNAFLKTLKST